MTLSVSADGNTSLAGTVDTKVLGRFTVSGTVTRGVSRFQLTSMGEIALPIDFLAVQLSGILTMSEFKDEWAVQLTSGDAGSQGAADGRDTNGGQAGTSFATPLPIQCALNTLCSHCLLL